MARRSGTGAGSWIIPSGKTGVVEFGTPADAVGFLDPGRLHCRDRRLARRRPASPRQVGAQAVKFPYDTAIALTCPGSMNSWLDGGVTGQWKLVEVAENVQALSVDLLAGTYAFKIARRDLRQPGQHELRPGGGQRRGRGRHALHPPTVPMDPATSASRCPGMLRGNSPSTLTGSIETDRCRGHRRRWRRWRSGAAGRQHRHPRPLRHRGRDPRRSGRRDQRRGDQGARQPERECRAQGGESRVYKVEIQNLDANGDIGITDFAWTSDAQLRSRPNRSTSTTRCRRAMPRARRSWSAARPTPALRRRPARRTAASPATSTSRRTPTRR
ncbi:MAG: hypothetical protein MZV65_25810 [Chromatiales bacterium]|nr:hypothetical protein [Chromatiales bacterium]